ncbi:MAG: hypothetical protein HZB26_11335 [Candidatus Hydrogenedentes bacterium]|nr:hypothetical protein [Candidatus Hydrogenedentota bacterium]
MKPIEKALLLRKSAHLRSKEPMRVFQNRMREPERLLKLAEQQPLAQRTRQEARRQYLVCVCAAFEAYWREFVRVNIDRRIIPERTIERLKGLTFTLADVHRILGRELTLGELISCSYSFQGLDAVNVALSEILQIRLFSQFGDARFLVREEPRKNRSSQEPLIESHITGKHILKSTCPAIARCFAIRHETVHDTGTRYRVSTREAHRIAHATWEFNMFLGMHLEHWFEKQWRCR